MSCLHDDLVLNVTEYGICSGFTRVTSSQLAAAAGPRMVKSDANGTFGYPAPLVLPHDALTDPDEHDPQSYDDYVALDIRNAPTAERNTIYLARPPSIDKSVAFMKDWTRPCNTASTITHNMCQHVKEYMAAFYHGLSVKLYDRPMKFTRQGDNRSKTPTHIDLLFGDDMLLDVRTRACPDKTFPRQLSLSDLTDVLINLLPDDAFAIMLLTDHDIWEDDEDLFTCGRAYGASRVGVVSTARYNPGLDTKIGLDLQHAWPASHCRAYIDRCIAEYEAEYGRLPKRRGKVGARKSDRLIERGRGMQAAVKAYSTSHLATDATSSTAAWHLWLARVCKTVSHELGHCIGIDHCCYYACLMQSTSGLLEDARQPPYLCPVDEAKLLLTTGSTSISRDQAMLKLLQNPEWTVEPTFVALEAWLRVKLEAHLRV